MSAAPSARSLLNRPPPVPAFSMKAASERCAMSRVASSNTSGHCRTSSTNAVTAASPVPAMIGSDAPSVGRVVTAMAAALCPNASAATPRRSGSSSGQVMS